jgi:hypothetical protein
MTTVNEDTAVEHPEPGKLYLFDNRQLTGHRRYLVLVTHAEVYPLAWGVRGFLVSPSYRDISADHAVIEGGPVGGEHGIGGRAFCSNGTYPCYYRGFPEEDAPRVEALERRAAGLLPGKAAEAEPGG